MSFFEKLFPKKKVKKSSGYRAPYLKKSPGAGIAIRDSSVNRANEDLTDLRYGATPKEIIRNYAKVSPDLSHVLNTLVRFIITDSYTVFAKDLVTGAVDPDATEAAQALTTRLDSLPPEFDGFFKSTSLNGTSETLLYQLLCNGDTMAELVLDKAMLPSYIQPISTNEVKYEQKGQRVVPYVMQEGENIYLDTPAIKSVTLNQDSTSAYSDPFFESAIQAIVASEEYRTDIRKAFRKASIPRVTAKIDEKKFREGLPIDVATDADKLEVEKSKLIDSIDSQLNGLNPEDAIVNFDTVEINHLSMGNTSNHESLNTHSSIMNGLVSAGLKTLPSILGRGQSQSVATTETVLMLKMVENLQGRLNELYSGLLTLALRLMGYDVVVQFKYEKPSLRPSIELESFKAMEQSRILQQLSIGVLSDMKASILLTGDVPPPGYIPLSGTGFYSGGAANVENPYSNTSVTGKGVDNSKDQKDRQKGDTKPKSNRTTG